MTAYQTAFERRKPVTDSMSGGLVACVTTPEGLRASDLNGGMCRLFERTREECANATRSGVITTVCPEDIPLLREQIARMIRDGTPVSCTYRIRSMKYGGLKWVSLRTAPAGYRGGNLHTHAVLCGVTGQRPAEEAHGA